MEKTTYKIIAVGDTHGRSIWKDILNAEKTFDKFVFIGDYFDSREGITAEEQISNFNEILDFKRNNIDRVVLLIGNHDFHYLSKAQESYSNFQRFNAKEINSILEPAVNEGLLQMCFVHDRYVFTHAGVTKTWCETYNINLNDLENSINETFKVDIHAFRFQIGVNYDMTGDDVIQSPIWVRIPSLSKDMVDGFIYVIGHTTLKQLAITERLIGIDTLGVSGEYLTINDLTPSAKKV